MLKSLKLKNFTVFSEVTFSFGKNLNVIVGENGTGKSHLLKAVYAGLAQSHDHLLEKQRNPRFDGFFDINGRLNKILGSEVESSIIHRSSSKSHIPQNQELSIEYNFCQTAFDFSYQMRPSFDEATEELLGASMVTMPPYIHAPKEFVALTPVLLPTRELLSIYPNFLSLYDSTHVPFEASWRDACGLLGKPYIKKLASAELLKIQNLIEESVGGKLRLDDSGRFYLTTSIGKMEMHMVAEGWRKLGMIAQLIANGSLTPGCAFLWDEPEANLNPRLIKVVAKIIADLSTAGIQVFIATHSLFLLRELHILQKQSSGALENRYFSLKRSNQGAEVKQGDSMDQIGELVALDEEVIQADRYIDIENGLLPRD